VSAGDFIAEEDIFIDRDGKVVEKKDAQTKLASKGARVSPEDVEKYGLRSSAAVLETKPSEEAEAAPLVRDTPPPAEKKPSAKKGKETA